MNAPPPNDAAMPHARCWNALPWYVNGTLNGDEAAALERHLTQCAACATELRLQRVLHAELRDGDAVLMAPQGSWQKMAERLDREDEALSHSIASRAPVLKWAVAAQALLIVGLIGALWQQAQPPDSDARIEPRYRTLTSSQGASEARGDVRVVFVRDVTMSDVQQLLREFNLQIVSGPSEAGVYTLARPGAYGAASNATRDKADDTLNRLRADARVVFAEPDRR
jgi:hypothetical protein